MPERGAVFSARRHLPGAMRKAVRAVPSAALLVTQARWSPALPVVEEKRGRPSAAQRLRGRRSLAGIARGGQVFRLAEDLAWRLECPCDRDRTELPADTWLPLRQPRCRNPGRYRAETACSSGSTPDLRAGQPTNSLTSLCAGVSAAVPIIVRFGSTRPLAGWRSGRTRLP